MANAYQQLLKSKASFCKGKTTKGAVRKRASAYVKSAVKSGQTRAQAKVKANRVLNAGCSTSSHIGKGKKKGGKRKLRVKHVIYGKRKRRHHKR